MIEENTFICDSCGFKCIKQYDWNRHANTNKHIYNINNNIKSIVCECGKSYKHKSSLSAHRKKCIVYNKEKENNKDKENDVIPQEFIMEIMKEMKQIINDQKSTIETLANHTSIVNTNSNNNSLTMNTTNNIKTFNLNIFLNETCKDAMNISEFVDSIKPQLVELEEVGNLGYEQGISNIILNNLKQLNITHRPIHCSDAKREILYIKDNNEWVKETSDNKPILTKAIKNVANKNIQNILEWKKLYPNCTQLDSKKNDLYLKIICNSMCASNEESTRYIQKVISNIAKNVIIDKNEFKQ